MILNLFTILRVFLLRMMIYTFYFLYNINDYNIINNINITINLVLRYVVTKQNRQVSVIA